jgi:hypothetical protein
MLFLKEGLRLKEGRREISPSLNPSPQWRDEKDNWTPAFAGVTRVGGNDSVRWIPAFAGMTKRKGRN